MNKKVALEKTITVFSCTRYLDLKRVQVLTL